MKKYIVRAALHEEANAGWVWLEEFPSRSLLKISHKDSGCSVVCEARTLDANFIAKYNHEPRCNIEPTKSAHTLVMSQWYRDALGGFKTTERDNTTGTIELTIDKCRFPRWEVIRAACCHPDIVARLGTRLGILGGWLGVIGLVPTIANLIGLSSSWSYTTTLIIAAATGLIGYYACRGPNRPKKGREL